ncbi:unnamed protein product [Effrenium voratum]|nr:unnamed protein product [Effrenium voratum]
MDFSVPADSAAAPAAERFLETLAMECPKMATELSGMGQAWLTAPSAQRGVVGLGGELHAVAAIRAGIRKANYAARNVSGRSVHWEVLHAARLTAALPPSTRCAKAAASALPLPPPWLAPPGKDAWGCPEVAAAEFRKRCLSRGKPCVLRQAAHLLLANGTASASELGRWLHLAPNATVKVSFPYKVPNGTSTLNLLQPTAEFMAAENVTLDGAPPWTLKRPGSWHMRLQDAIAWAQRHPTQEIYMNQAMVADLGSAALAQLQSNALAEGLELLQPSLWLASGAVTTGYHSDGPENLLAQLTGAKKVALLRPQEAQRLRYQEVLDVEPLLSLDESGATLGAAQHLERRSTGHSVIDVAQPALPKELLDSYKEAKGMTCDLQAGDVLYIPSRWHHAVFTTPDDSCTALSLNLWYHRKAGSVSSGSRRLPRVIELGTRRVAELVRPSLDRHYAPLEAERKFFNSLGVSFGPPPNRPEPSQRSPKTEFLQRRDA